MARSIYVYATWRDYEDIILPVERTHQIKYVLIGYHQEQHPRIYKTAFDLPNFGVAPSGDAASNPSYLIAPAEQEIRTQPVELGENNTRYKLEHSVLLKSITFRPSGTYWKQEAITRFPIGKVGDDCLIQGAFESLQQSVFAQTLFRAIAYRVRKAFVYVNGDWLGAEALSLLDNHVRLTSYARGRLYDVRRPPATEKDAPAKLLDAKAE